MRDFFIPKKVLQANQNFLFVGIVCLVHLHNFLGGVDGRPDKELTFGGGTPKIIIPDYIQSSLLSYCEKCTESQKKKISEVLLLLLNLNGDPARNEEVLPHLIKNTIRKLKVTSSPKVTSSMGIIPTPQFQYYKDNRNSQQNEDGVIASPTGSTTPATTYYSPSTTVSAAPDPVQSVEMPTPPLPPTTTLPIYFYYLSSSSIQPPTTPVVESSVASKSTTVEP